MHPTGGRRWRAFIVHLRVGRRSPWLRLETPVVTWRCFSRPGPRGRLGQRSSSRLAGMSSGRGSACLGRFPDVVLPTIDVSPMAWHQSVNGILTCSHRPAWCALPGGSPSPRATAPDWAPRIDSARTARLCRSSHVGCMKCISLLVGATCAACPTFNGLLEWLASRGQWSNVRAIRPLETSEIPTCTKSSPSSRVTRLWP